VPMNVPTSPSSSPSLMASRSLTRISSGARGNRPLTRAPSRFRISRSGLPGERRSTARPATGAWARVSPRESGRSKSPEKRMRGVHRISGYVSWRRAMTPARSRRASSLAVCSGSLTYPWVVSLRWPVLKAAFARRMSASVPRIQLKATTVRETPATTVRTGKKLRERSRTSPLRRKRIMPPSPGELP
jgi:hypothetical protein